MKKLFYALMLVFAAVLGGCRGEHSLGKDIYVYVFTQDFDAERIGGEFEMTGFSKGTYVPQNEMFTGDSVVVTRQFGKEFVPYRVPLSVLRLLTPEEYRASTGFECLLGWLYLQGNTARIETLFEALWTGYDPAAPAN